MIPPPTATSAYPTETPLPTATSAYPTETPLPTAPSVYPTETPLPTALSAYPTEIPLPTAPSVYEDGTSPRTVLVVYPTETQSPTAPSAYNQTGSLIQTAVCVLYQEGTQQHSVKHVWPLTLTLTQIALSAQEIVISAPAAPLACLGTIATMTV